MITNIYPHLVKLYQHLTYGNMCHQHILCSSLLCPNKSPLFFLL